MWPFGNKYKDRVDRLERSIESYREDNEFLRNENKRLKEFELKCKIMEMYVEDDEAIIELLEIKEKEERRVKELRDANLLSARQADFNAMHSLAQQQWDATLGSFRAGSIGALVNDPFVMRRG